MLKTAAEDPRYLEHELVRRYSGEIALMSTSAAAGHNLGWESPEHRINVKAGALVNSGKNPAFWPRWCSAIYLGLFSI